MTEEDAAAGASSEAEQRISGGPRDSGAYFYKSMSNGVQSSGPFFRLTISAKIKRKSKK
jgi:hypothetical protein